MKRLKVKWRNVQGWPRLADSDNGMFGSNLVQLANYCAPVATKNHTTD